MAKSSTTLKKGDNLPKRGKAKKTLMLDAIREVCGDEKEFLRQVVEVGLGGAVKTGPDEDDVEYRQANPMLLNMVLNRIEPPLKSVSPLVEFSFNKNAKPYEQALQVLEAVSSGKIPADIGSVFVTSISSMLNIQEKTDFEERLKAMEDQVDQTE